MYAAGHLDAKALEPPSNLHLIVSGRYQNNLWLDGRREKCTW
jgi:hypothetical protein